MFLQFTFPNTLPRRLFCCQGKKRETYALVTVQVSAGGTESCFAAGAVEIHLELHLLPETGGEERSTTYRFALALDAVHDAEGLPQVWVPCVLQGIKPTSERTSC